MPPPPPPAPPPPPPPVIAPPVNKAIGKAPVVEINALLKDIRGGAQLKKTVTNDRSAPLVSTPAKPGPSPSNSSSPRAPSLSSSSVAPSVPNFLTDLKKGVSGLRPVAQLNNNRASSPGDSRPGRNSISSPSNRSPSSLPINNTPSPSNRPPSSLPINNTPSPSRFGKLPSPNSNKSAAPKAPPPPSASSKPSLKSTAPPPPASRKPLLHQTSAQAPGGYRPAHSNPPPPYMDRARQHNSSLSSSSSSSSNTTNSSGDSSPRANGKSSTPTQQPHYLPQGHTEAPRRVSVTRRPSFVEAVGAETHKNPPPPPPMSSKPDPPSGAQLRHPSNPPPPPPARPSRRQSGFDQSLNNSISENNLRSTPEPRSPMNRPLPPPPPSPGAPQPRFNAAPQTNRHSIHSSLMSLSNHPPPPPPPIVTSFPWKNNELPRLDSIDSDNPPPPPSRRLPVQSMSSSNLNNGSSPSFPPALPRRPASTVYPTSPSFSHAPPPPPPSMGMGRRISTVPVPVAYSLQFEKRFDSCFRSESVFPSPPPFFNKIAYYPSQIRAGKRLDPPPLD